MNRHSLEKLIAEAPKRFVQIGDTLHAFIGVDRDVADQKIARALSKGVVVKENGVTQWVEFFPVRDNTKQGSDAYTWHSDGNRVSCEKVFFTRNDETGEIKQTTLCTIWCDALNVL